MYGLPDHQARWEYHIEYIYANASKPQMRDFLATYYPGQRFPKYAAQTMKQRLDELGAQGWELVQMEPVWVQRDGSVMAAIQSGTNTYLCSFKRLKRSAQQ